MDNRAAEMERLKRASVQGECGGKFEPKPKLDNEKPQGEAIDYDELIKS